MIKTIIADDEILVRVGLKSMVDWQAMGFEIVGEAGDGLQALELCKNQRVDLVITDIKMPKMDGLELIRTLGRKYPSTKIVVLSCYNEGEYIKEAMKYHGALDYIFKIAMDKAELQKTLENVKKIVYEDRAKNGRTLEQHGRMPDDFEKIKVWDHILNEGNGQSDKGVEGGLQSFFDIPLQKPYVCIAIRLFQEENFQSLLMKQGLKKEHKLYFVSSVSSLLGKDKVLYDISFLKQEIALLISMEKQMETDALVELCKKIDSVNHLWSNAHMSFGISSEQQGEERLSVAFAQAREAQEASFFYGEAKIKRYQERERKKRSENTLPVGHELMILLYENPDGIRKALTYYFRLFQEAGGIREEEIKENCFVFLSNLTNILSSRLDYDFLTRYRKRLWERLMSSHTLEGLQSCVEDYTEGLLTEFEKQENRLLSPETKKALQYIQENYKNELRLKNMAEYIGINESYLSHLFKKEYGKSLITYLNEYRILKAQELILSSAASLNLIAEEVGYPNYTYFSKVFKSITGINAIDFRSNIKKV